MNYQLHSVKMDEAQYAFVIACLFADRTIGLANFDYVSHLVDVCNDIIEDGMYAEALAHIVTNNTSFTY